MIGTPNASCTGYFHDATNGYLKGWSIHSWTILDNPHIPGAKAYLTKKKQDKGWTDENAVFLREWCGRWIRSEDSLVYRFNRERNVYQDSEVYRWDYVLGVDLGFDDATAFVVVGFLVDENISIVLEGFKQSGMIADEIAEQIKEYQERFDFRRIVADTGGLGKMIVEELNRRHGLQVVPAEKTSKHDFIELLNADLHSSRLQIKLPEMAELAEEWELLQWDEDRRKEAEQYENHLADACLYAWRESTHWMHETLEVTPEEYSEAWYEKQEDEMFEQETIQAQEEQSAFWEQL